MGHQKEALPNLPNDISVGRIGCLAAVTSAAASPENMIEFGVKLAIHVAAASPKYLDRNGVPQEELDNERNLLLEQAASSKKPQNIIERMVEGRMGKFYEDRCLVDQKFVTSDGADEKVAK